MLIPKIKDIYDEYNIYPDNNLKARKIIPEPVSYIDSDNTSISPTRYNKCNKLIKNNKIYYETYSRYGIVESTNDSYYTVDSSTVNRLDIIANYYYNNPSYWWIIAIANNIIDPFNIKINTVLRIPDILSLYLTGGILSND